MSDIIDRRPDATTARPAFGRLLKQWRQARNLSQLDLALTSNVSQRHVSFLESGRARPSREMVMQLAATLDIPLRHQNALLLAAGFAPAFRESALSAPELSQVNRALDFMLEKQEPYPASVIDSDWNLLRNNRASRRMYGFLAGLPGPAPAPSPDAPPVNIMHLLLSPDGVRPLVENWTEIVPILIRRSYAEAMVAGRQEEARQFLDSLRKYPDVPSPWLSPRLDEAAPPVVTVRLRRDEVRLNFFSTIATLGTAQDVTLQEIRIESYFPADEATEAQFKRWAAADAKAR